MLLGLSGAAAMLLCAAMLTPSLSSVVGDAPQQRDAARVHRARLIPPEADVAQGVPFALSGRVSTARVRREVELQRRVGRKEWRPVGTTRTDRRGRFTFDDVQLFTSSRLRGHLPASADLLETKTKSLFIRVRAQRGTLTRMPAVSQQGPAPASPRNDTVVSARFDPAVPGRPVLLERRNASGQWVPHATEIEDAAGFAVFNVPPGATYRATARSFNGAGPVRTNTASAVARTVIFEDTFDGPTMDPRWEDFILGRGFPGSGRTCALTHPSQHSLGGGVLRLGIGYDPTMAGQECVYTTPEGSKSSPYLYQSQLATYPAFRFTYGLAAARIKFSRAPGRHSAFWLQVGGTVAGDPATGTEIDAVEFFGDNGGKLDRIGAFLHYYDTDGSIVTHGGLMPGAPNLKPPGDTWWDSFHVFSVAWTPTEYVFRVDGREFYREAQAISRTPQWLTLSAISSDYELEKVTPQNIDEETEVDWVRVWTL